MNTIATLQRQRIASGFGFLDNTAGFDIIQTLVPYDETSTYGRVLLVGVLNTLLVAAIGIVLATMLGFVIGIGQLSSNWLIARLCAASMSRLLRNLPLLLQIFFWYFAVLRALPGPRESWGLFGDVFLNNRGLYLPGPEAEAGVWFCRAGVCRGHCRRRSGCAVARAGAARADGPAVAGRCR